ncbi:hypothetical protein ACOR62_06915 [Neisseria lisongii]|uniref:Kinase n=1 Tax=Neisseria lisongii TaxID=2912188 RepID=A0AAW5AG07_9NEIS|nr:hypothetical protein [Neisseria lisongii]MCF7530010.1 hypothetical protein [Neisseria lisongii]
MTQTIQPAVKTQTLHKIHLLTDGNAHAFGNSQTPSRVSHALISEAMLPQIRTVATLIAAARHDFCQTSPDIFTEEADFFAARILVLGVRRFHLDITLTPMLKTANRRAQAFAKAHNLSFQAAEIHMSLHNRRPADLLIIETEQPAQTCGNIITDSLNLARSLPQLPL